MKPADGDASEFDVEYEKGVLRCKMLLKGGKVGHFSVVPKK